MEGQQQLLSKPPNNLNRAEENSLISPFCDCCPLKRQNLILNTERGYYKKQHERAKEREETLKKENEQLKARIRYLEHRLYGRKTEKAAKQEKGRKDKKDPSSPKRPKGQQAGNPGPQRRDYAHLPVIEEEIDLEEEKKVCPYCGLPFKLFPGTEDSETIEYETITYRRRKKRKRYRKVCSCPGVPGIITASRKEENIIPKGRIGTSIWVEILINKFQLQMPLNKILQKLSLDDISLAPGTVVGGLKKLHFLFAPIYDAIHKKGLEANWWHADETRWLVFVMQEGKLTYRWYLWVFISECTVYYIIDPNRSTRVVEKYFGVKEEGILCVDRYSAYKSFARDKENFILAFCWDHTRRDFIDIGKKFPKQEEWAMKWIDWIGKIYHINNQRIMYLPETAEFQEKDKELRDALDKLKEQYETELDSESIPIEQKEALERMKNHWNGLMVFVDHPYIPMSNSEAERMMRNPAVGRKNYYGSGAVWSAEYTAMMFSIFQTMRKHGMNEKKWLLSYLKTCAECHGKAPPDISSFLPWNMNEKEKTYYG
jgi:transposase